MFKFQQAILVLFFCIVGYSAQLNHLNIIPLKTAISVKANKDTPAYQAFALLSTDHIKSESTTQTNEFTEELCLETCTEINLNESAPSPQSFFKIAKPVVLAKTYIQKADFNVLDEDKSSLRVEQARTLASVESDRSDQFRQRRSFAQPPPLSRSSADVAMQMAARQPVRYPAGQYQPEATETELIADEILASLTPEQQARLGAAAQQNKIELASTIPSKANDSNRNERSSRVQNEGVVLTGHILLSDGLALTDQMTMSIHWQENGAIREVGQISRDWKYQIKVIGMSGVLVGKVFDGEGKLIGQGVQRLNSQESSSSLSKGPEIVLVPSSASVTASVRDFYDATPVVTRSRGQAKVLQEPKKIPKIKANLASGYSEMSLSEKNTFTMDGVNENSFALLRTQAPQYYQTNQIVASNDKIETFLYPVGMMKALREIVADQRSSERLYAQLGKAKDEEVTIIWGKIEQDGQPVDMAEITLEGSEDLIPIYFNSYQIPDPKLKSTSENGLFAFLGPNQGLHSLVARRGLKHLSHVNVFVEQGAVAAANMNSSSKFSPVAVKSFDAFTGNPIPVQLQLQSIDFLLEVLTGDDLVHLPPINRLSFAEAAVPDGYVPSLYTYNDQQEFLSFPLITYDWLNRAAQDAQRLTGQQVHGQLGTLVGFVSQEEFVVQAWGGTDSESVKIIYFDQTGKILDQNTGVAGGGFVIFNVVDAYKHISIDLLQSQTTSLRVFPIDAGKATIHPLL